MQRIEALRHINELTSEHPLVVTCAATSRELASIENRDNHFYVLDSMGLVGSIATGLALASKNTGITKVIGVEGDGSLLMNPNVLPSGGYLAPENLLLILLDNQVYGSTAGLPTYADRVDLAALASAAGWVTGNADDPESLRQELQRLMAIPAPTFLHVRIDAGNAANIAKLLVDPVAITARFTQWFTNGATSGPGREEALTGVTV